MNELQLLTKQEIAKRYRLSQRTINELMRKRILPYYRMGGKIIRFDPVKCDIAISYFEHRSIYDRHIQKRLLAENSNTLVQDELFPKEDSWEKTA